MIQRSFKHLALVALVLTQPLAAQDEPDIDSAEANAGDSEEGQQQRKRTMIVPYIEASQVFTQQFDPVDDFVTYTQLAAGVDASLIGRSSGATVSVRYERNFAWEENARDHDTITGIARGYTEIIPRTLQFEAGALASRTRIDGSGRAPIVPVVGDDDTSTQTYSLYAGPTLSTQIDAVKLDANYRIGYSRVDGPDVFTIGGDRLDLFDESLSHSAMVRAATAPGAPLPVGLGVGAGFYQEDVDNLDQRVRDAYVRGDVTIPVSPGLALVAGVGAEDVEVSSRDAVRDTDGNPVIGDDGRYLVDPASPRVVAFDASGVIWDVGAIWEPSSRTRLQASFGRRYDSETLTGSFDWKPDSRSNFSLRAYDAIQGFGGRMNNALSLLPTDFEVIRDPITGDIIGCNSTIAGSDCLSGILGSVRSAVFRGRGVAANYSRRVGNTTFGAGAGYDNRKFIGAPDTVLELTDGITDETVYVFAGVSSPAWGGEVKVNTYASWIDSGVSDFGDSFTVGSSAQYSRRVYGNLYARAAISAFMLDNEFAGADLRGVSLLLGARYEF